MRRLILAFCLAATSLLAGPPEKVISPQAAPTLSPVPIDYVDIESAYVFGSDFKNRSDLDSQESWQNEFEYGHRFQISGNWYLRAGVNYNRFDFSQTNAPLPVHLQSGSLVVGIDYMHGAEVGAFLQFRPGIYTEEHIRSDAFDCPILLGRFWTFIPDQFYLLTAVRGSFLSAEFPVVPLVGFVWTPCPQWRVMAVPPEPRIIYSVNKQLDVWIGGQIEGSAFRMDHHDDFQFRGGKTAKLSGAVVDYTDYRAGLGLTYSPTDNIDLDLSGGCSVRRDFDFKRADQSFRTDPAPYVELEIKAKF